MYTVTMMNSVVANANLTTSSTILEYPQGFNGCKHTCEKGNGSLEVIATGTNAADATVKLQHCDSGVSADFTDVENGSLSIIAAGAYTFVMTNVSKTYYRLVYEKGANTTGTIKSTLTFN